MTQSLNEQLSACLDGEIPQAELDLLLRRTAGDDGLRQTLGRYSLIGEALRGHGAACASSGFADRVSAAIAADTGIVESGSRSGMSRPGPAVMRWLRPAAGAAIAASVAAVAVFAFQAPTAGVAVVAQAPVPEIASDSYIVPSNTVNTFVPATRLTNYVVAHSEYSSPLGRRTVLSGVLSEEDESLAAAAVEDEEVAKAQVAPAKPSDSTPRQ